MQGTHHQQNKQHLHHHQQQPPKEHYHSGGISGSADSISSNDSNSINSSNRSFNFWKSSPEEERAWSTRQRLRSAWKYSQWPLALLFASIITVALVYFLATQSMGPTETAAPTSSATILDNSVSDDADNIVYKHDLPNINGNPVSGWNQPHHDGDHEDDLLRRLSYKTLEFDADKTVVKQSSTLNGFSADVFATNEVSRSTDAPYTESMNFRSTYPLSHPASGTATEDYKKAAMVEVDDNNSSADLRENTNPFSRYEEFSLEEEVRSVESRKILDKPSIKPTENSKSPRLTLADIGRTIKSTLMFPSEETLKFFGFTSGHQNNFGVPIEEDERMLRMLNEQLRLAAEKDPTRGPSSVTSTTDSNLHQTRVSPTLPILNRGVGDRTTPTTQRTLDDSEGESS